MVKTTKEAKPKDTAGSYTISEDNVTEYRVVGGQEVTREVSSLDFMGNLTSKVPFFTGFMPPGLRSYSKAQGTEQYVIELPPAINMVYWSQYEGGKKTLYELAQPWRIIIAEVTDDSLIGARMFYSPHQLTHIQQPLYHANVSNLNCYGYGPGLSVGWVCLYHKQTFAGWSIHDRMMRIIERCDGGESYNFGNMAQTDGQRLYREHAKPDWSYLPKAWEKKTEEEGLDWVLDPDLWIPVLVKDRDEQTKHVPKGQPLTLEMAMNGSTQMYYRMKAEKDPGTRARLGEFAQDFTEYDQVLGSCMVKASTVGKARS